jgi:tripartite-type tricarboxylate transporter receptor subunit TctC
VPTILELTSDERARTVLKMIASTSSIGRTILSTPDVPKERLEALRAAFDRMVQDPRFIADAAKRRLGVDPAPGAAVAGMVADVAGQPDDVVEAMKRATAPPQ